MSREQWVAGFTVCAVISATLCGCFPVATTQADVTMDAVQQATQVLNTPSPAATTPPHTTTPTQPPTPSPTSTPSFTATPVPTQIPALTMFGPGEVHVPILLYHHFEKNDQNSRYTVEPEIFSEQLNWLSENGYKTIMLTDLVSAVREGKALPEKPFIITIDDGNLDVYTNAFPLLKQYNYTATVFLIVDAIGDDNMLTLDMIQEMRADGWDFGSHSITHANLVNGNADVGREVCQSKQLLESMLGTSVDFFAYPFGEAESRTMQKVYGCQYLAGMGLGTYNTINKYNLYYVPRREVQASYSMDKFRSLLTNTGE